MSSALLGRQEGGYDSQARGSPGNSKGGGVPPLKHPHCDRQAMYAQPVRTNKTKGGELRYR